MQDSSPGIWTSAQVVLRTQRRMRRWIDEGAGLYRGAAAGNGGYGQHTPALVASNFPLPREVARCEHRARSRDQPAESATKQSPRASTNQEVRKNPHRIYGIMNTGTRTTSTTLRTVVYTYIVGVGNGVGKGECALWAALFWMKEIFMLDFVILIVLVTLYHDRNGQSPSNT